MCIGQQPLSHARAHCAGESRFSKQGFQGLVVETHFNKLHIAGDNSQQVVKIVREATGDSHESRILGIAVVAFALQILSLANVRHTAPLLLRQSGILSASTGSLALATNLTN